MSKLILGLSDHLAAIEAHAYCVRNAVNAGMKDAALENLETVIASLREALASLAHENDIVESRESAPRVEESLTFGDWDADNTKKTWNGGQRSVREQYRIVWDAATSSARKQLEGPSKERSIARDILPHPDDAPKKGNL